MKRIVLLFAIVFGVLATAEAQKIAYINTESILAKVPAYKTAQGQLERLRQQYQKEIESGYEKIEGLYKTYQNDKVLLTEDMKKRREEEIITREKEVKELQRKYFGQDGAMTKKSEELLRPIQDKVMTAVKEVAADDGYAIILDAANNPSMIYTNPRYDISDKIITKLGYK